MEIKSVSDANGDRAIQTSLGKFVVKDMANKNCERDEFSRNLYLYGHGGELVWQVGEYQIERQTHSGRPSITSTFLNIWIIDQRLFAHNWDDFTYEIDPISGIILGREHHR